MRATCASSGIDEVLSSVQRCVWKQVKRRWHLSVAVVRSQMSQHLREEGRGLAGAPLDQGLEAAQQAAHVLWRHLQSTRHSMSTGPGSAGRQQPGGLLLNSVIHSCYRITTMSCHDMNHLFSLSITFVSLH